MHTPLLTKRPARAFRFTSKAAWPRLLALLLLLLGGSPAWAQLTGAKAIPGAYPTLAAAITDLNAQGVGAGGVTFNVAAGYTETAANLLITATGTAANPIVFQKTGTGANPLITAGVGVNTSTTTDCIIGLSGSDYVTFDGINLAEAATNTTATTQMEFGYALYRASATDGCQNNIIRNCVVTLDKTNTGTIGIAGLAYPTTSVTAVAATSTAGANSTNKVYGNVVTNSLTGIYFNASSSTSIANYDQNNEIGVTAGNTIGNFGGTAAAYGAGGAYQNGLKITGNTLNSTLNYTSATASTPVAASTVTNTLRGIYTPAGSSANLDIVNNVITLASGGTTTLLAGIDNGIGGTPASNTVAITGNTVQLTYATATTGAITGIVNSGAATTVTITGNTVQNTTAPAATTAVFLGITSSAGSTINLNGNTVSNNVVAGTGTMTLISSSLVSATSTVSISNNTLTGNSKTPSGTTAATSLLCLTLGTAITTITGNTITNNSIVTSGTSTTTGTLVGLNSTAASTPSENLSNNIVTGLSISGTSTSTTHVLRGILTAANGTGDVQTLNQNTVGNLAIASGAGTVTGITVPTGGGTGSALTRNKIYDLSATGAAGSVTGLLISAGGTYAVTNNLIGDLRAPAATGLLAVSGLTVAGGTAVNAYYNTIYLNASSSGATFGTSGVYLNSTSATLDLRNNIVVNKSTAAGTGGYTVALRRVSGTAGTVPANLAPTTNNNLYYAGTPSATNLIYAEGTTTQTNAQQTLAAYQTFAGARESGSVTEDVPFLSTTGTAATFLHISPGTPTQVEGGALPIAGITTDFDGDTRSSTTPDLGADEGTFQLLDVSGPAITYTALGNTSSTANRTLTVTITDVSGVATGANAPRLYFRKGTSGAFSFVNATTVSGSTYTFAINYATVGGVVSGNVIQYYVAAQDLAATPNLSTSPVGGTGVTPPGTTAPGTPNSYTILASLAGTYYVGTSAHTPAATYATLTAAAAAYNGSGLAGAVNFVLIDPTYSAATGETFPIVFNGNPDASATNRLTIKPEVAATVSGSNTTALVQLNGSSYVTLDGAIGTATTPSLTLANAGSGGAVVQVKSLGSGQGATNVTLKNLSLTASSTTSGVGIAAGGATVGGSGDDNDNLTIQNNVIQQAYVGIYVGGTTATSAGGTDGLVISNNLIGPATAGTGNIGNAGLFVANAVAPVVSGNTVQNVVAATATALTHGMNFSTGVSGAMVTGNLINGVTVNAGSYDAVGITLGTNFLNGVVDRNRVLNIVSNTSTYSGRGIDLNTGSATSNVRISNNFVAGINGAGWSSFTNDAIVGIRIGATSTTGGVTVAYNSVNLTGNYTGTSTSAYVSAALYVASSATGMTVVDNVLVNSLLNATSTTTKNYALYSAAANTAYTTIDYNDYYVSGAQGILGYLSSDKTTLADLRTATAQDVHSISVDPQFVSATDLHVQAVALNNVGTPVTGITTDIDGDTRSTTTPDIGADEFTPLSIDIAAADLIAPAAGSTCYGPAETVSVSVRNSGTDPINFATNPATVTVVVTPPSGTAQTFTATVNTGTLASAASQTVTLPGTLNMTALGTYSFAITATVVGDANASNNLLTPAPTRTVVAPVAGTASASTTSICVSGNSILTLAGSANGSVQWQQSSNGTTFTDVTGANAATFTTPVLTSTMYYRATVTCNTNTVTSNVVTVTVNNPLVASVTSPVSICAGGSATLAATGSTGTTVRYFDVATGGTALASATVSPTASTTYYAEAFTGSTENVGATAYTSTGQTPQTGGALYFTTTAGTTISNVTVYLNAGQAAGTVTIALRTGSSTAGAIVNGQNTAFNVPAGPATGVAPYVIPLNFVVPAAGSYTLHLASATQSGLLRDNAGANINGYPYTSPSGTVSITGASVSGYYYYFYNWQLGSECASAARTPIQVNVVQPATTSFPAATATSCGTSPYQLAGTVTGSVTTGTYTSSGTGTFAPNATTLNATYTPSAADVAAGFVNITLTSGAGTCAATTAALRLNITAAPTAGFSYPTASICAGQTATVSPALATGATAGTFSSTAGLTISAAGVITPATSTAGTYTVTNTVAAAGGCAAVTSTATVTINAVPATPTATVTYPTVSTAQFSSSAAPAGTTYQWYLNGVAIPGATSQTYTANGATSPGAYTVRLLATATGCQSAASAATTITAAKPQAGTALTLFPNPTRDGNVTLQLSGYRQTVTVTVLDATGRLVLTQSVPAGQGQVQLNLTGLAQGVYLLRASTAGGTDTRRLVLSE